MLRPLRISRPPSDEPATGALIERYVSIRRASEALCAPLSDEDCVVQSMPDCSPAKWHLAHTAWFFETFVLERGIADYARFHPAFRVLFNSYYQTVGEQYARPRRGLLTRPSRAQVMAYRRHVDARMLEVLARGIDDDTQAVVELGLQHEQQHQELILTDVKHLLWCNPMRPAYREARVPTAHDGDVAQGWIGCEGGLRAFGHDDDSFAFDNEGPRHRAYVAPFELAACPVTVGQYLEFIEAGGYRRPELWLSMGWDAVNVQRWQAPLYWDRDGSAWTIHTLHGTRALALDEPVCHLSYFEADAYARFAGARLPTELEWELVAATMPIAGNFVEDGLLHPQPAAASDTSAPLQLFGDVWEWTASAYAPYPGYRPAAGALGEYNGKFMCNQYVLRGGSCATPRAHIRPTYRNFFPADARWQFSGVRLARDVAR